MMVTRPRTRSRTGGAVAGDGAGDIYPQGVFLGNRPRELRRGGGNDEAQSGSEAERHLRECPATMTAGPFAASSPASAGRRSLRPSAQRSSITTCEPSSQPVAARPSLNAANERRFDSREPECSQPISTGCFACSDAPRGAKTEAQTGSPGAAGRCCRHLPHASRADSWVKSG